MNCYGSWDPEHRHPIETIGYNDYLDAVVTATTLFKSRIKHFYISGGMKDTVNKTECETTKPELERRLREKNITDIAIQSDEKSLTSMSIVREFLTTWQEKFSECQPILFVDQVRYENNCYTLTYFAEKLGLTIPPAREIIVGIPRLDIHPNSTPEAQSKKLAYMKEHGVEAVEKMEIEQRQAKSSS
jgi:hypothetical protein